MICWTPPDDARATTQLGRWMDANGLPDYDAAWRWSITELDAFWRTILDQLVWSGDPTPVLATDDMPGAVWCPNVRLNYAENVFARGPQTGPAVVARSDTRGESELTLAELADAVGRARDRLAALGVGRGDRVVAYMPNIPETLVAFLATASLGAIWSSCPPEFGVKGVVDRFAQIEPKVLLAIDGYRHRGDPVDRRSEAAAIASSLPSLADVIELPYLSGAVMDWGPGSPTGSLTFDAVPFAHPLYILYSSGTTGLPKPIVHCHGGILLEHRKVLTLHHDIGTGSRFSWFTTTGWMMWNLLISGLLAGASIVVFDGDPGTTGLWELAATTETTHAGVGAPYIMAAAKRGEPPVWSSRLRELGSTGAPLPAEGFRWVYSAGSAPRLASVSGGTDVCTAFVGGNPLLPVIEGEITCRCLGAAVDAFSPAGTSLVNEQGNLVVTRPMPSMPVGLWGDTDGRRYRASYFDTFPGVWDHGDWITITDRGTCIITGRSDATLNRGGVRIGTSELYSVVEALPGVADSLVVHLEEGNRLLLFVVLEPGATLPALAGEIKAALRTSLSPRHVPDEIIEIPAVPRTLSGKKLEVPVKRILSGVPAASAASKGALADPASLAPFEAIVSDDRSHR